MIHESMSLEYELAGTAWLNHRRGPDLACQVDREELYRRAGLCSVCGVGEESRPRAEMRERFNICHT